MSQLTSLPDDLPVPEDDGACDHLIGMELPDVKLSSTCGKVVTLSEFIDTTVLYFYPMTGQPNVALPDGWDEIPGARGCTPQSCSFRDHQKELLELNAQVFGISTQSSDYQTEAKQRLHLPFDLLSDEGLNLKAALAIPTFDTAGMELYKRVTLIAEGGKIKKVFYPVFPPDQNAGDVIRWLKESSRMKLSGIVETALYADDLVAMREFYENTLGLDCISYKPGQHVFFKINRSMLLIFNRNFTAHQTGTVNGSLVPPHATEGPGHMAFEALENEYQQRKDEIIASGIEIESEVAWPNQKKSFYFRDCAANSIEITEYGLWETK